MIPDIAPVDPADIAAGMFDDDAFCDGRAFGQRFVDIRLERDRLAAAHALIRRDDDRRIRIVNAPGDGIGREPAEYDRMHRTDPRTGQYGDGDLRDHRQINRDPIALFRAIGFQDIGEPADFFIQLAVGQRLGIIGIVTFPDDRRLVAARRQVPVETVHRGVQRTVLIPADMQIVPGVGHVLYLGIRLDPVDPLALLTPEGFRVIDRLRIHLVVLRFIDQRVLRPVGRDRKKIVF